ncbi:helix-turn-helix transcriptional regulator [Microbacterium sp. STN6]|uniref:helix-turn-helix transcriptional regulator n=1 Tax=Microbacterium sp. STN6 TaxID=2995588 RepID=UPI002260F70D|nr:helix-turn-helix transcriptional regulator [Microbacterium sp. STN6]MCX7523088.1 helix-turn-helix transcriptional regulator [Microbacterium sp. STN6]
MSIQSSLKQARVRAGLSLTDAAKHSGIQRSNIAAIENGRRDPTASTIEKIASASRVRLIPVKSDGRTSVAEAATTLADAVRHNNIRRAYRTLIQVADDLTTPNPADRFVLALEPPAHVSPEWDAALAGIAEWCLSQAHLPLPAWITSERGNRDWDWTPPLHSAAAAIPVQIENVPKPLRERGVLIEADDLASV